MIIKHTELQSCKRQSQLHKSVAHLINEGRKYKWKFLNYYITQHIPVIV